MQILARSLFYTIFFLLVAGFGWAEDGDFGRVTGRLVQPDGSPQQEAAFFLFDTASGLPPSPGRYFRLPDRVSFVDPEGNVELSVPPGEYWYGAIQRGGTGQFDPEFSDWLFLSRSVEGLYSLKVEKGQVSAIGDLVCATPLPHYAREEARVVTVQGVVRDQNQRPLANFYVDVFGRGTTAMPLLFRSQKTAADGRYALRLAAGEYSLRLRRIAGRNRNGVRNKDAERYVLPKPVALAAHGDPEVVEQDFMVRQKTLGAALP